MKLATVKSTYRKLNARNFGGVLVMPRILFSRSLDFDGQHSGAILEFSLRDVTGLDELRELVYHEQCHQYVDEFLRVEDNAHHGRIFVKTYNKFCNGITTDKDYSR